jgi:hypothetical protein
MARLVGLVFGVVMLGGIILLGTHSGEQPLHKVEKVVSNAALAH